MAGGDRVGLTVDDLVARGMERKCCVHEYLIAQGERAADAIGEAVAYMPPDLHACDDGPLVTFLLLRGIEERFPHGAAFVIFADGNPVNEWRPYEPGSRFTSYRPLSDLLADKRAWGIACRKHVAMVEGEKCSRCNGRGRMYPWSIQGQPTSTATTETCFICNGTGHTEPTLVLPVESWPRVYVEYHDTIGPGLNVPIEEERCLALEYATELGLLEAAK